MGGGVARPRSRWGEGAPHPADWGVLHPRSRWGGYPSSWWGVPHPRSRWGYPIQLIGIHHPTDGGTPSQVQARGTNPGLDGAPPFKTGWGNPPLVQDWMGYPPILDWMGDPSTPAHPRLDGVPVRKLISKASTCYAAGGVPLAFTQ